MKKVYAVRRGRKTGLFMSWPECQKQVDGFPGARFKGFTDANEAVAWLREEPGSSAGGETPACTKRTHFASKPKTAKPALPPEDLPQDPDDVDYVIYTDGSCLRNPAGPGGWAAVILDRKRGVVKELSDGEPSTTNNRMELSAAIAALSALREGSLVDLYTDSQYLKNAFTRHWIDGWKRNGWMTAKGKPVLNQDLWHRLITLFAAHKVRFHWVKGHAGNAPNERCDELAKAAAMRYSRP